MGAITEICVQNFRSVADTGRITLDEKITPLIGPNGAGKTSTLSAIAHLAHNSPVNQSDLCLENGIESQNGLIKIVSVKITGLHDEQYPFFSAPLTLDDLEMGDEAIYRSDLYLAEHLEENTAYLTKYANGRRVIEFPNSDRVPNLDAFEFMHQRMQDHIRIVEAALNHVDELGYIGTDTEGSLHTIEDCQTRLDATIEGLSEFGERPPDSEADKELIDSLERDLDMLRARGLELDQAAGDLDKIIPPIIDGRELVNLERSKSIGEVTDSNGYRGLLALKYSNVDTFEDVSEDELIKRLRECASELQDYLNGFWDLRTDLSQDPRKLFPDNRSSKFEVSIDVHGEEVSLKISEDGASAVQFGETSKGVQWIVQFLLTVVNEVGNNRREAGIFLLDDLGQHLHPGAQRFLHATLKSISAGNQIIYCTHSPFLIDTDKVKSVRLVEWDAESGTAIRNDMPPRRDGQVDLWAPVRDALGAKVANLPFASHESILFEGYTELSTIPAINTFFRHNEDRFAIGHDVNFLDFDGSKVGPLSKFLEADDLEHIILLDDDQGGRDTKEALKKMNINMGRVKVISDLVDFDDEVKEASLEDVFGEELYIEAVVETQPGHTGLDVLRKKLKDELSSGQIPDIYEQSKSTVHEWGGRRDIEVETDKGRFADQAVTILNERPDEFTAVLDRFEDLLKALEDALDERWSSN